jgi:hypothetical protein
MPNPSHEARDHKHRQHAAGSSRYISFLPSSLKIDDIAKIFEILAIIVGGLWALHAYFEFQKQNEQLTITQQQLSLTQAQLANEAQKITLDKSRQVRIAAAPKLTLSARKIGPADNGNFLYFAELDLVLQNTSEATVNVDFDIINIYLSPSLAAFSNKPFAFLNTPPSIYAQTQTGGIQSEKLYELAHIRGGMDEKTVPPFSYITNGGLTGSPRSGDKTQFDMTFTISARPDQVVSVIANIGVDWGGSDGHFLSLDERILLENIDNNSGKVSTTSSIKTD